MSSIRIEKTLIDILYDKINEINSTSKDPAIIKSAILL